MTDAWENEGGMIQQSEETASTPTSYPGVVHLICMECYPVRIPGERSICGVVLTGEEATDDDVCVVCDELDAVHDKEHE